MKNICLLLLPLFALLAGSCTERTGTKVVERPLYGLQNSKTLEIDKITLTDTSTILHMDAYFHPKYWIRVDTGTYIQANGVKYLITGSENIALGEYHWMPDSGEDHFKLFFPPLPKGTKTIDFIESDCDDCFKIWDIDLTGKAKEYKPQLPKDILGFKIDKSASLPEPVFKTGRTKVTLNLTGIKEGYVSNVRIYVNNIFTGDQEDVAGKEEAKDKYVFEFDQYSTANAYLKVGNSFMSIVLSPGENMDVYYDATAYSLRTSRYHSRPGIPFVGFKGEFAQINNQLALYGDSIHTYRILSQDSTIIDMTKEQFVSHLSNRYNAELERLGKSDLPAGIKQIVQANLKSSLVSNIRYIKEIYLSSYRYKHKLDWNTPIDYTAPETTDKEYMALKDMKLNDPYWTYSMDFSSAAASLTQGVSSDEALNEITGSKTGLMQDIRKSHTALKKAPALEKLTPEEEAGLKAASTPYYAEVYKAIYDKTKAEYDKSLKEGDFVIVPTPEVPSDKILDAIVAQYKGKVVFVDFWATWCGPCIQAMKTIKPFKPEMAEKGIVSIYISNASSPKAKWAEMLADIGGLHYYLSEGQWRTLSDKYQMRGIPTYMIFNKKGEKTFETAGYPGNDKIKKELEAIW